MPQHHGIDELVNKIDGHLAYQEETHELSRPDSRGTMMVDWDGIGTPVISYRNRSRIDSRIGDSVITFNDNLELRQRHLPPTPTPPPKDNSTHQLDRNCPHIKRAKRQGVYYYIQGYDPNTQFQYDYDGNIMHIHRDSSRASSQCSEYYTLDARKYQPQKLRVVDVDKELPPLPEKERRKREKVVKFIDRLLRKLDAFGVLKKLRPKEGVKEERSRTGGSRRLRNGNGTQRPNISAPMPSSRQHIYGSG